MAHTPKDQDRQYRYSVALIAAAAAVAVTFSALDFGALNPAYHLGVLVSILFTLILIGIVRSYYMRAQRFIEERVEVLERVNNELRDAYSGLMDALIVALDMRDHETYGHAVRVVALALVIAERLGLSQHQKENLILGGLLHDIGKIAIPDSILYKPEPLTEEEWEEMKKHPAIGYRMVQRVKMLKDCSPVILHHHERWDGTGYPMGLGGDAIPIEAQIFALADAVDAMTSDRPYKAPIDLDKVYEEVAACKGTHFSPRVAQVFLNLPRAEVRQILDSAEENMTDETWLQHLVDQLLARTRPATESPGQRAKRPAHAIASRSKTI